MKTITRDRIISALAKVQASQERQCNREIDIIASAARIGLRTSLGQSVPDVELRKFNLELDYHETTKDPISLELMMEKTFAKVRHLGDIREKIFALQSHCDISGLELTTTKIGHITIEHLWESEDLRMITSDLPKLAQYKEPLFAGWLEAAIASKSKYWVDREQKWEATFTEGLAFPHLIKFDHQWQECSLDHVIASLPYYDWATVWSGWGELHFDLGNGINPDLAETERVSFCACVDEPSY